MWIEIDDDLEEIADAVVVTFREEGVDWNAFYSCHALSLWAVTFREEGVDWNIYDVSFVCRYCVTFREEGVDWNIWYRYI